MSGVKFNEATRVQLPALVHLTRLGYKYYGKISESDAGKTYDPDTNILLDVFERQFDKLNPSQKGSAKQILSEIRQELGNNDLGKAFYERLTSEITKLVDFDNPENNEFNFTAEFTCKNGNDEFRPDITLFVNGLPLVFIEVKKPNNAGGIIAESDRMNDIRFPNPKFRKFLNVTQFMIFSNNMEYSTAGGVVPIEGAFYSTISKEKAFFNCFREESINGDEYGFYKSYPYKEINSETERIILSDFNCQVLHTSPEYQKNLSVLTPTNRIITSMCSKSRMLYLIKYGIAYVNLQKEDENGKLISINQKHIMRYQQFFASLAVQEKLEDKIKSGVIWHTQGSGKTALSYHLTKILTNYYAKKEIVPKFYFIVDRLDLLEQSSQEFEARGLVVKTANSRQELMEQFRTNQSMEGNSGKLEITVVNIQRFEEDKSKVELPDYATNLQRVFIIDEAHRGYKPEGSFLANLFNADPESVKIALTGTPLLKEERASWKVFGNYIHTYYYDKSIQDGYTLKIIREDIETQYREKLNAIYDRLDSLVEKNKIKKADIVEHESYVEELTRYIIKDLKKFRAIKGDDTLGGMVICETSNQAKKIYEMFNRVQSEENENSKLKSNFKSGLILHDSFDKETRKQIINDFKKNMTVDILIVFNMLLTGFDAPRLKRLYFSRKLKDHNLLQAITRVNRPYKDNRYGYIIDFADIKKNFDETNVAYLAELERFNTDVDDTILDTLTQVIESKEDLIKNVNEVREKLFEYTIDNLEDFSDEISAVNDKDKLLNLKKALIVARDSFNIVRTFGDDELKEEFNKIQIDGLPQMISEVQRRINIINQKQAIEDDDYTKGIVNEAMLDIEFNFEVRDTEELRIISKNDIDEKLSRATRAFIDNIDHDDPEYITIWEAFRKKFKEKGFTIRNTEEYEEHSKNLDDVIKRLEELKRKNDTLVKKYNGDVKFARVHKRIREENRNRMINDKEAIISNFETQINEFLNMVKTELDREVYDRNNILKKDAYFKQTVLHNITSILNKSNDESNIVCESEVKYSTYNNTFKTTREDRMFITDKIKTEYINQYNNTYAI